MKNNLGKEVIRELKTQRQMGRYFSYKELQKLKKIETTDQLDQFLKETNHGEVAGSEPPSKLSNVWTTEGTVTPLSTWYSISSSS